MGNCCKIPKYENYTIILEKNLSKNEGALIIGNYKIAQDTSTLKKLNVKYVLTVAKELKSINFKQDSNMIHKFFPAEDEDYFDISQYFEESYQFIEEGLSKGSVLVHCAAGSSRSAAIIIFYLKQKLNWKVDDALKYLRNKRYIVDPQQGFLTQIEQYQMNKT